MASVKKLGRDLNGYSKIRFSSEDRNWINYLSVNHVPTSYEVKCKW